MPARLRLSWDMKTWKVFFLSVFESLEFGWQVIRYASSLSRPSSTYAAVKPVPGDI